ncbi:hypothetical protein ONS95_003415 [Cadophora gregata]|uniref:uncharacterized protein n=1 Tax=Cadophora gregata TaxID=51156 RepID=UPI0026DDB000|nr:uncharacterized protein ONS95_003415 [Cadophora gregata]KAK0108620.1 hypothetical protein ONS95_003415 [Cadophora gregata]KAK0108787.1 hypothetical protein ONS96_002632 [Cadophora gregata f. sp. sojae]
MAPDFSRPVRLNRNTVVTEFDRYFGSEVKLENWQRLCHDVGITDVPQSLKKCKLALRRVWVNIHDLIIAVRQNKIPHRFQSQHELSAYTLRTRKFFPKEKAKEGGPVRQLLAHIF